MLALRSAPPVFSVAEAERVAREVYGLAVSGRPLPGERDCNFHVRTADGRDFVLKIVDGTAEPGTTECQVEVLRHLAEQAPSLRVPRLLATLRGDDVGSVSQDGRNFATCLMAYLPGTMLADSAPGDILLGSLGGTLARLDRALQGFFHPSLSRRIAWDVRRLPELAEHAGLIGSEGVRRDVLAVCASMKERLPVLRGLRCQAIHGDCHAGNLLVDPAGTCVTGILDFGDMIHGPLVLEPAVAMSELLTDGLVDPERLSAIVESYALSLALEPGEIEVLFDLVTGRHAVTLLLQAWRECHDPQDARVLDRSAERAAGSLRGLLERGRGGLTRSWHAAAGTGPAEWVPVDLGRRHRLLGAGAELFYDAPLHLVRGEGVWLYDPQGRAYLDVYNNVPHVGHAHPVVVRAIQRQTALLATHTRYLHHAVLEYAEALTSRLPRHLDACIFVNSGSEANDVAWRLAQFATGRQGALVMSHAYHGITDAVALLTPGAGHPVDPRVTTVTPPADGLQASDLLAADGLAAALADAAAAVQLLAERGLAPAAFYLDSGLTSSGIHDPPAAWGAAVTESLRAAGALIVADEVQYGLGRSGSHFWGFERRGIEPDIVTLGKPVGNGYPMGAVIARRPLIEAFQAKFGFFSTFGGNAVAAAAGLAVLRTLDRERLQANAERTGTYLRERLQILARRHRCLGRVRGAGLLVGLEIRSAGASDARARTKEIVNALAARARVLIGAEGPGADILKLRPPMVFREEHADLLVDAIDAAAAAIDSQSR